MGDIIKSSEREFTKLLNACVAIEKQLEAAGFHLEDATDEKIAPIMQELWDFAP